jgi:exosortase H (IPTLxxWG-CTERM-specific)
MGRPMSRKRRKAASSRHAAPPAAAPSPSGTTGTPGGAAGGSGPGGPGGGASGAARLWRRNRREITFLVLFVVLLGGSFTLISVNQVNDQVIEPFTGGVARLSGAVLNLLGQHVALRGTVIQGPHFAVNIRNGCNGVEAMLIFLAAVLAFPAPWRWRVGGLVLGILAIQVVNLVRVVSLYLTGAYLPHLFDASHTVIWQSVVILFGVLLWIFWANRLPPRDEPAV